MKILVTAGGTSEKIDEVRKITNMSSGRLGALIAEEFAAKTKAEIVYICGMDAVTPKSVGIHIIKVASVNELQNNLTKLFTQNKFDAVIHSMAVSDYSVRGFMPLDDLISSIAKTVYQNEQCLTNYDSLVDTINSAIAQSSSGISSNKKISSDIDSLTLFMERTPKIIKLIKRLQPETILVGFKLLVNVSEDALLKVGHNLLRQNNCDFVLANDLEQIHSDSHIGILIKPDCSYLKLSTKREIAETIANNVLAKIRGIE